MKRIGLGISTKTIIAPDGMTDIYKIKKVLGDHMCIMRDVPPALRTLGTPDGGLINSRKWKSTKASNHLQ